MRVSVSCVSQQQKLIWEHTSVQDGTTPLHLAAFKGNPAMLSLLLANGGDANAENCDGQTPLFEAANAGHADALQVLLDANADTGARS